MCGNHLFSDTLLPLDPAQDAPLLAVSRRFAPTSFFLCLLMLQKWAVRQFWPPWEWRATEHGRSGHAASRPSAPSTNGSAATAFTCGTKRYCREMASCAEARFYLSQCGLTRLDGDGDGIPCEKLCR